MRSLASILDSMGDEGPDGGVQTIERISASWKEAAGEGLASLSRPSSLRDGELVVRVDHPAAAMEMRLREGEIISALSAVIGAGRIRKIVTVGRSRKRCS